MEANKTNENISVSNRNLQLKLLCDSVDILIGDVTASLAELKEYITIVPKHYFKDVNNDIISVYSGKMQLLRKNLKFCFKELKKDFRAMRRKEKKLLNEKRKGIHGINKKII